MVFGFYFHVQNVVLPALNFERVERKGVGQDIGLRQFFLEVRLKPVAGYLHESKLVDEAQVGGMHEAYVVDAPAENSEAVEAHAERETTILGRIDTRIP